MSAVRGRHLLPLRRGMPRGYRFAPPGRVGLSGGVHQMRRVQGRLPGPCHQLPLPDTQEGAGVGRSAGRIPLDCGGVPFGRRGARGPGLGWRRGGDPPASAARSPLCVRVFRPTEKKRRRRAVGFPVRSEKREGEGLWQPSRVYNGSRGRSAQRPPTRVRLRPGGLPAAGR